MNGKKIGLHCMSEVSERHDDERIVSKNIADGKRLISMRACPNVAMQVNMCVNGFMIRVHDFLFAIVYAARMN